MTKAKIKVCGSWLGFENYCALHDIAFKSLGDHCYEADDKEVDEMMKSNNIAFKIEKCSCTDSVIDADAELPSENNVKVHLKNVLPEDIKAFKKAEKLSPQDEPLSKYYDFDNRAGYFVKEDYFDYAEYQHTKIDYAKYLAVMGVSSADDRKVIDSMEKVYIIRAKSPKDAVRQIKALNAKDSKKVKDAPLFSMIDVGPEAAVKIHQKYIDDVNNARTNAEKVEALKTLIAFLEPAFKQDVIWADFETIRNRKLYSKFKDFVEMYRNILTLHKNFYNTLDMDADWATPDLMGRYAKAINNATASYKKAKADESGDMAAFMSQPDGTEFSTNHPGKAMKNGKLATTAK